MVTADRERQLMPVLTVNLNKEPDEQVTCRCVCEHCVECRKREATPGATVVLWCGGSGHFIEEEDKFK